MSLDEGQIIILGDGRSIKLGKLLRYLPGIRKVHVAQLGQQSVIVKLFLSPKRARIHLHKEQQGLKLLQQAGLQTPTLLYSGATVANNRAYALVMTQIPFAKTLAACWLSLDIAQRQELLAQMVTQLACLHRHNCIHGDLHLGNFLIAQQKIWLIDGDQVKKIPHLLSAWRNRKNLALLFANFTVADQALLPTAWQVYRQKMSQSAHENFNFQRFSKLVKKAQHKRLAKYAKKCLRSCSEFICQNRTNGMLICRRDYLNPTFQTLIEHIDDWIDKTDTVYLKQSTAYTVALIKIKGYSWVIKRYAQKLLSLNRARKAWCKNNCLRLMDETTPKPIALLECRLGPFYQKAYLITEYVNNTEHQNG